MGEGQIIRRLRVAEIGGVEVEAAFPLLCPVDPAPEVAGFDRVALHDLGRIQIDGVKIEFLRPGDQAEGLFQIHAEFRRSPGPAGIVPGGKDPAGCSARVLLEAVDVVPLPAVE